MSQKNHCNICFSGSVLVPQFLSKGMLCVQPIVGNKRIHKNLFMLLLVGLRNIHGLNNYYFEFNFMLAIIESKK